jgi:diguanylate cyclase (GGDEF)-like protein
MEALDHKHIYYALSLHPHADGLHRRLLGKFILHGGRIKVLEDHGFDHDLEALSPAKASKYLESLSHGQRTEVVNAEDLRQGLHMHLLPSAARPRRLPADLKEALALQVHGQSEPRQKYSSFDYHRDGMPAPQHLEVHGEHPFLDGQRLQPDELQALMLNVQKGAAKLRHRPAPGSDLAKIEKGLAEALAATKTLVQAGHLHPDHHRAITKQIFSDTMLPEMGNKLAYEDFKTRPREGVHIHLDGNDFGSINKIHGHEVGDKAIRSMGKALREAMDESVGRKLGKMFRTGGDEFVAHVPSPEHAAAFSRALRTKLEAIPAIGGTHRLSMSVGYGHTKDHAEAGLQASKAAKKAAGRPQGQADTHVTHFQGDLSAKAT